MGLSVISPPPPARLGLNVPAEQRKPHFRSVLLLVVGQKDVVVGGRQLRLSKRREDVVGPAGRHSARTQAVKVAYNG